MHKHQMIRTEHELHFLLCSFNHCTDSVCPQAIPWQEYPSWAADDLIDLPVKGRFVGPVAVVDGYVLQAPPFEVWDQKGDYNDVPFVIGSTEQEEDFR